MHSCVIVFSGGCMRSCGTQFKLNMTRSQWDTGHVQYRQRTLFKCWLCVIWSLVFSLEGSMVSSFVCWADPIVLTTMNDLDYQLGELGIPFFLLETSYIPVTLSRFVVFLCCGFFQAKKNQDKTWSNWMLGLW